MQRIVRVAALAVCLCVPIVPVCAQTPAPTPTAQIRSLAVPRLASRPRLEQFLDGNSRADMKRVDDFRQRQPGDGVPATQPTSVWLGYDQQNFYAIFRCTVPPGQIRARMSKREDIMSDDIVGLLFDTYHSGQRGYEFYLNPLGIQADAALTEGQGDDFSFDTLWYSEGRLIPEGYLALFAIPFKSLRFPAQAAQTWGIALFRSIPTNNESIFWPYVTEKINSFTPQMGTITGLENISPGRNLQLIPYAAFSHSHFLDPLTEPPAFRSKTDFRPGIDGKAVIHDTLTLDLTLNPDFSQVESDDPQVTVNQRFEVVFPEKRPFFLENTGYFSTPENLFFSRRIVDPEFGGRLTGKLGHWNLGILAADDRAAGHQLDPSDPNFDGRAAIAVVRVQREIGKSNVGVLFTQRTFAGAYNRVAALDTRLLLSSTWNLSAQAMTSQDRAPDGTSTGGPAYTVSVDHGNRKWNYGINYVDRSPGFHTDLGYVPRVNMRQGQQYATRHFRPKSKRILSINPGINLLVNFDHLGIMQDRRVNANLNIEMPRSTYIGGGAGRAFERFQNINFHPNNAFVFLHSDYFKRASVDLNYSQGTRINYTPAAGLLPFQSHGDDVQANITLRPSARLKIDETYIFTRMRTPTESVYLNHLTRTRINYQFTRALSLRMIVDYNALLENAALIDATRQKRLSGDVLLTYLLHPGTALYLGYTDRLENLAIYQNMLRTTGFPSTTTARQFFAKVSYLFRF